MNSNDRAKEIVAEIRTGFATAGGELAKVYVTDDPLKIPATALAHGVICIGPPDIEFPTGHLQEIVWSLIAVCGPATNTVAAWRKLSDIIRELWSIYPLDSATTGTYQARQNEAPLPAYTIKFTDE